MVEHLAVNEVVPGSSPGDGVFSRNDTQGASAPSSVTRASTQHDPVGCGGPQRRNSTLSYGVGKNQAVRALSLVWLERRAHNSVVAGSNPAGPIHILHGSEPTKCPYFGLLTLVLELLWVF